jgi:ribose transport system ATP-binding protein
MSVAAGVRLEMAGIRKAFGATEALKRVDLRVGEGEVHALVGENGAGKSTLMKVLSGAVRPDAGTMVLDGIPYAPRDAMEARRRGVGMIYQELSLAPHLSVAENIVLGAEPTVGVLGWLRRPEIQSTAREALARLGHGDLPLATLAGELSVSLQQLVEVARALALGCKLLVFDEPTSSLTQADSERLFVAISGLRAQGISVIYISHFLEEVRRLADRVTVLRDGVVVETGPLDSWTQASMVRAMAGRDVVELYPNSGREPGEVVLEMKHMGGEKGVSLRRGEIVGIFGLIGAGRTELMRAVFGLDRVRRGEVRVGAFRGWAPPAVRWRQGVGYLSENRKEEGLALGMSIADNVTLTTLKPWVVPRAQEAAASRWMAELGVRGGLASDPVGQLSGGNQQKVAMARLLEHDVDVFLLDEPTRGIDVAAKARLYDLVNDLATRRAKAVLVVSSYMPELLGICDRIAVMCRGRLVESRPASDWTEHTLMLFAMGRDDAGFGRETAPSHWPRPETCGSEEPGQP